jgi:hypothetical protein
MMTGGSSHDLFVIALYGGDDFSYGVGHDVITDFEHGEDRIDLQWLEWSSDGVESGHLDPFHDLHLPEEMCQLNGKEEMSTVIDLGHYLGSHNAENHIVVFGVTDMTADDFILG